MSYDGWKGACLTPLERAAGVWGLMFGRDNGDCTCGECDECDARRDAKLKQRKKELEDSARFKEAAKLVAGLSVNREIKLTLIQKVHQDSLESAIVRYMANEALPTYYADILRTPKCIDILVEGIFYKVCRIPPTQALTEQINTLSNSLRYNPSRLTAYDRVTQMQQFIHRVIDQSCGVGTARSIPVLPMKNALSAARLHLSIIDILERQASYTAYIDSLSTATWQLEYDEPRPSTAPPGKQSWPRWRVRHLRPLSYYFPKERRALLQALVGLDENTPLKEFTYEALLVYSDRN